MLEFVTKGSRQCSIDGCGDAILARKMCRKHYNRWYYSGDPAPLPTPETCPECGGPITRRSATGPAPSYCSRACRSRGQHRRDVARGVVRARPRRQPSLQVCEQCGTEFERVRTSRFCSLKCSQIWRDREGAARCSDADCDLPVRAKGLCAKHWRRAARADGRELAPAWSERRRANWKKRDALKRGAAEAEAFSYVEVYERDGWVCGVCGGPVDPQLAWPDPMSVSLDHVVPLSKGGPHCRENAQCSHLVCNTRKGDRLVA